jgi:hypothetical protein
MSRDPEASMYEHAQSWTTAGRLGSARLLLLERARTTD